MVQRITYFASELRRNEGIRVRLPIDPFIYIKMSNFLYKFQTKNSLERGCNITWLLSALGELAKQIKFGSNSGSNPDSPILDFSKTKRLIYKC